MEDRRKTSAEYFLTKIDHVYAMWRNGDIPQEDALFRIGDILDRAVTDNQKPVDLAKQQK
jgi:hypothetical protein